MEEYHDRYGIGGKQSRGPHIYHTEGSGQGRLAPSPPDLQDPSIKNAAAVPLPKLIMAILFLKKAKPITQEQGYLDLLTPSVTLKVQLFDSCSYSRANASTSKPQLTTTFTSQLRWKKPVHAHIETKLQQASDPCIRTTLYGLKGIDLSCFPPLLP